MAEQQLALPGQIVKKRNELVRSKINISGKTAARILACLVACIRNDDTRFKDSYTVSIAHYLPDEDGRTYARAKAACKELVGATVEMEWPDPENLDGDPILLLMPFFTSIKYRKGNIEAKFNPEMSEALLQLRNFFTQYNLMEYLTLPSTYSQRIFEILKSWSDRTEVVIQLAELHKMLDTPESLRANFKDFRRRVLEKAHVDIHKNTTLVFEWEPVQKGRGVSAVRFIFAGSKRVALQKEKTAKKRQDDSQHNNKLVFSAVACAKEKGKNCPAPDNKPEVCKMCRSLDLTVPSS